MSIVGVSLFFSLVLFVVRFAHSACARAAGERPDQCFVGTIGFIAWAFLASGVLSLILLILSVPHPEIFGMCAVTAMYAVYGFRRDQRWLSALPAIGRARE